MKRSRLKVIAAVSAGLFALVAFLIAVGWTQYGDVAILRAVHPHAILWLDAVVPSITYIGEPLVVSVAASVLALVLVYFRRWIAAIVLLCGIAGSGALNYIAKHIAERARPELWERIVHETSFSFPSGHATASMALALCVVALLWNTRWRTVSCVSAASYVVIVGLTRLYLGVHYPSDIIAGWLMSIAWVAVVVLLALRPTLRGRLVK